MDDKRLIPSMFHRRLVLIGVIVMAVMTVLTLQIGRLTVVEGAQHRADAEATLDRKRFLPTYRGRIVDRFGQVLATDRAGYDVAVHYDLITGAWALDQANAQARREVGRIPWAEMTSEVREAAMRERLPQWQAQAQALWDRVMILGGIDEAELTRRRDQIRREVHRLSAHMHEYWRREAMSKYGITDESFDMPQRDVIEERSLHTILPSVDDETAFHFRRLTKDYPGLIEVRDARTRWYPWQTYEVELDRSGLPRHLRTDTPLRITVHGVADHMLGDMRDGSTREDIERRPFLRPGTGEVQDLGGYRLEGEMVGLRGLERAYEDHLRGTRGVELERKDTGEVSSQPPEPGHDLQLTIDIMLQARVQAILSPEFGLTRVQPWHHNSAFPAGATLNSAAVVLEIDSGEILAMVAMPTMTMGADMTEQERARHAPFVNRPVEAIYPPGSILKPLVACAAIGEGVHRVDDAIECTGHYFEHRTDIARCWIYREQYGFQTHGALQLSEAVARSCNLFFYTLGDRLGMHHLRSWFRRFGLDHPLDTGLMYDAHWTVKRENGDEEIVTVRIGEVGGSLPTDEQIDQLAARGELQGAQVFLGIGQGPVAWTPLHAANAYATIARGGVVRDPTIVRNDPHADRRRQRPDISIGPRTVAAVMDGLRQAVNEHHGSGHHIPYPDEEPREDRIFNVRGVDVWGKTGTAQAPAPDLNGDGRFDEAELALDGEHAWFVGFVGPSGAGRPTHAIAVVVEYGGSGGRVAGPLANEIIRALQTERHLPPPEAQP